VVPVEVEAVRVEAHEAEGSAARRACELAVTPQPVPQEWTLPRTARRLVDVAHLPPARLPTAALRQEAERRSAHAESVAAPAAQADSVAAPPAQAALRRVEALLPEPEAWAVGAP
jgi:hypothetical protein